MAHSYQQDILSDVQEVALLLLVRSMSGKTLNVPRTCEGEWRDPPMGRELSELCWVKGHGVCSPLTEKILSIPTAPSSGALLPSSLSYQGQKALRTIWKGWATWHQAELGKG